MKTVEMAQATAPLSDPKFLEIMERSRQAHREQGGISPEEMRSYFGIKSRRKARKKK